MDTSHLFAAALHVHGTHFLCDLLALGGGDGSETLCFKQVDAGALVAEIRFEADENDWRCWAEMEDFWVPLFNTVSLEEDIGLEDCYNIPCP